MILQNCIAPCSEEEVFSNPAALWRFSLRRGQLDQAVAAESEAVRLQAGEPGGAAADGGRVGEQAGGFFLLGEGRKSGSQTLSLRIF
jgi:hypothetical protein